MREIEVQLCLNKRKLRDMYQTGMKLTDELQTVCMTITQ